MSWQINNFMLFVDNFLETTLINDIEQYVRSVLSKPIWQNGGITVHKNLTDTFKVEDLDTYISKHFWPHFTPLPANLKDRLSHYMIENKKVFNKIPKDFFVHLHHSGPLESYPWHTDVHSEYNNPDYEGDKFDESMGITIYLNKNWSENWGGYFLYKKNKEDTNGIFVQPVYNRAVFNNGFDYHGVSATALNCDVRISVQMFVTKNAVNPDYLL
jgi:hypothetical protein